MSVSMNQHLADCDLVALVANGNNSAFDHLVLRYQSGLLRFLDSLAKNRDAAKDLSQDALIKAFEFIRNGKFNGSSFRAWLWKVAENLFRDRCRRLKVRNETSIDAPAITNDGKGDNTNMLKLAAEPDDYGHSQAHDDALNAVISEIDKLPEVQRIVLKARLEGEKSKDIAKRMGCSVSTIVGRVFDAKERLRTAMRSCEHIDIYYAYLDTLAA